MQGKHTSEGPNSNIFQGSMTQTPLESLARWAEDYVAFGQFMPVYTKETLLAKSSVENLVVIYSKNVMPLKQHAEPKSK